MKQRFLIILQRKKQGKPFCCCCHDNKDTRSRVDAHAGFRCCGYAPLAIETDAKNTAHAQTHAQKGTLNASFEVDGGGTETPWSHVEGNLTHTIGGSRGGREGRTPPPGRPNSFDFMQFSGKFGVFTPPLEGSRPPSGKSWIRHCIQRTFLKTLTTKRVFITQTAVFVRRVPNVYRPRVTRIYVLHSSRHADDVRIATLCDGREDSYLVCENSSTQSSGGSRISQMWAPTLRGRGVEALTYYLA